MPGRQISIFHEMTLTFDWMTMVWPWPNLWSWPQTSQTKLNWCPGSKINIFHEMTLTLTQWPWYSNLTWILSRCTTTPKNEVSMPTDSKVIAQTDRQTHTHTDMSQYFICLCTGHRNLQVRNHQLWIRTFLLIYNKLIPWGIKWSH